MKSFEEHRKYMDERFGKMPAKAKALGKVKLEQPRRLTPDEQKEKTKNWPKGPSKELSSQEKRDYQDRYHRAYND